MKNYNKVISIVLHICSIALGLTVTCNLLVRYLVGQQPFTQLSWLIMPTIVLSIIWSEKFSDHIESIKVGVVMELVNDVIYLITIGTFISMILFQSLREMTHPVTSILQYSPWVVIAMFAYVLIVGPIGQFKRSYK
jgi:hypothetical protein